MPFSSPRRPAPATLSLALSSPWVPPLHMRKAPRPPRPSATTTICRPNRWASAWPRLPASAAGAGTGAGIASDCYDGALDSWTVGAGIYARSEIYFDQAWVQGSYAIASAKIGYRMDRNWDLALNIGKLFDRTYLGRSSFANDYNMYGEPRSFRLTLCGNV